MAALSLALARSAGLAVALAAAGLVTHGTFHTGQDFFETGFVTHIWQAGAAASFKTWFAAGAATGFFKARLCSAAAISLGAAALTAGNVAALALTAARVCRELPLWELTG